MLAWYLSSIFRPMAARTMIFYEKVLSEAKDNALQDMEEKTNTLGANLIIGIDLDYEVIGRNGSMLMVSASGAAVRV